MVTQRRPHWTDELILSFTRAMGMHTYDERAVYAGIAAVEDCIGARADRLQAVAEVLRESNGRMHKEIQAVREVCDEAVRRSRRKSLGYAGIHYVAVESILDAMLDGGRR